MFYNNFGVPGIGPDQLKEKISAGEDFYLLDVRTPAENLAQAIAGSHLIPLQELAYRIDELPKDKEIIVYCRVGNRSTYAALFLARQGYQVINLEGGIVAWNTATKNSAVMA